MIQKISSRKGFSLIELLIVIAIIVILGVAFLPQFRGAQARARDAARVTSVEKIVTAVEKIYNDDPSNLPKIVTGDLTQGCIDFTKDLGLVVANELKEVPKAQPSGVTVCNGGYWFKFFKPTEGISGGYMVVVQAEQPSAGNTGVEVDPKDGLPPAEITSVDAAAATQLTGKTGGKYYLIAR